jgi:hypothetical protein
MKKPVVVGSKQRKLAIAIEKVRELAINELGSVVGGTNSCGPGNSIVVTNHCTNSKAA